MVEAMPAARAATRDQVARMVAVVRLGMERWGMVEVQVAEDSKATAPKVATTVGVELLAVLPVEAAAEAVAIVGAGVDLVA